MSPHWIPVVAVLAAVGSLVFSTLTYSLRDLSRVRLADYLQRHHKSHLLEPTLRHASDLILATAIGRMICNTAILLFTMLWCETSVTRLTIGGRYALGGTLGVVVTLFSSVAIPHALSRYVGDEIVGLFIRPLHALRLVLLPLTKPLQSVDSLVRRSVGAASPDEPEQIEHEIQQEILSAVEEGEKEGVVDEEEREMIESVIQFHDTSAGQIMTPRPEIVALELTATLALVKQTLEESGHSRLPVYDGTLDHIVGILYARDLLKHIGLPAAQFNIKSAMRLPYFVPETKPLRDLLHDFRLQKVHIAIVLDEYGGTAGLITIEDILEELVGDISDEHEPVEPAMFKRIDENIAEVDARIYIDALNRLMGLNLPEDAGYDTLGGYVSTALGRIPEPGAVFEQNAAKFTVLDAEPQKVNRVKIELLPQHAAEPAGQATA